MSISEKKFSRLTTSVDWSQKQLEIPRAKRIDAIKQFVGFHYAGGGSEKVVPMNFIKLAMDIYTRTLAPKAPRVLVTTSKTAMKPAAANLELALNMIPIEINLGGTLRRIVTEALFSIGVAKIGLHAVGEALGHEYGKPFVDVITLDNYFLDMTARHIDEIQYEGNDYWLTEDELHDSDHFKKSRLNDLTFEPNTTIGEHGEPRAEGIAIQTSDEAYKQRVWVRDVWVPGEKLLHTYAVRSKRQLGTVDWTGPERGMYRRLGFFDVPGNLLPLPPVSVWRDLHDLSNVLFRKLSTQADNQKTVAGFPGGQEDDVNAFKGATDGDGIQYNGRKPEILTAGGVSPTTLAFVNVVRELSSYYGGNLDSIGGLAAQTETVGQDKMLTESAGAQMREMSGRTVDFVRSVFRDLAYYEWGDPVSERTLQKPIPGMGGVSIPMKWDRNSRQGDFNVFDLDIDVYSLQDDSPGLKLRRLGLIMQTYVLPLMPEIQAQGGQLDVQAILRTVAKYADFPELAELVTFVEQSGQQAGPAATTNTGPSTQGGGDARQQPHPQGSAIDEIMQSLQEPGQQA